MTNDIKTDFYWLFQAANALGYGEPISFENDGTVWLHNFDNKEYLSPEQVAEIHTKAIAMKNK